MADAEKISKFKTEFETSRWSVETDGKPKKTKKQPDKVNFLRQFLERMRLTMLLKQSGQDASVLLDPEQVELLQSQMASPDKVAQSNALTKIKDTLKVHDEALEKSRDVKVSTGDLLEQVLEDKKSPLIAVARKLDADLLTWESGKATPDMSDAMCADIFEQLTMLDESAGEGIGVRGLDVITNKIDLMRLRYENVLSAKKSEFAGDTQLKKYGKHFENEQPEPSDLLQIRKKKVKKQTADLLTRVKKNAKEEIFGEKAIALQKAMRGDDAVARLKDVSELMAQFGAIDAGKLTIDQRTDLEMTLLLLRDRYEKVLTTKVVEEWNSRNLRGGESRAVDAVRRVVEKHRSFGSSKYKFEQGDFAKISQQAYREAKSIESRVGTSRINQVEAVRPQVDAEMMEMGRADMRKEAYAKNMMSDLDEILLGSTYKMDDDFWEEILKDDGVDHIVDKMKDHGVKDHKRARFILEAMRSNLVDAKFEEISMIGELTGFMKNKDYGAAMNLVMEYISRIGLQETTSDFKIVFMLRQLQDKISLVNDDASAAFNARKLLRYLPGIHSLPPEKFGEYQARLGEKSTMDYLTNPNNIFMTSAKVDFGRGHVEEISSARMLSALRSRKHALKMLGANVNTNDSTLRGIMLEEMFGRGAKIIKEGDKQFLHYLEGKTWKKWDLADENRKIKLSFADIDATKPATLGKWRDDRAIEMTLGQALNRNQWMLQDAAQLWWYSRAWETHLRNYPKNFLQMQNAPKALAAVGAMMPMYQASFENVARPMVKISQLGTLLGPLEVYKTQDMVGKGINDKMIAEYKKDKRWKTDAIWRMKQTDRADRLGKLFANNMIENKTIQIGDREFTFAIDTLSREQLRLVGNNIDINDLDVMGNMLLADVDDQMAETEIPTLSELKSYYAEWTKAKDKTTFRPIEIKKSDSDSEKLRKKNENTHRNRVAFWSSELDAIRGAVKLRKFNSEDQALWNTLSVEELQPIMDIETKVTGKKRKLNSINDFWSHTDHGALVDWSSSMHKDDPEQYGGKYYQKELEAAKLLVKIWGLNGTKEDLVALDGIMRSYVPAPQRRTYNEMLLHAIHQAESNQVTSYEIAAKLPGAESPNSIDWITLKDSNNNVFFARDEHGSRAYNKEQYNWNYAWREMGHDLWRDSDFEIMTDYYNSQGDIDKHRKHQMDESIIGIHNEVAWAANKLGLQGEQKKKFEKFWGKWGGRAKIILKKHPLFDDTKWALYMLFKESWEYTKEVGSEIGKGATK